MTRGTAGIASYLRFLWCVVLLLNQVLSSSIFSVGIHVRSIYGRIFHRVNTIKYTIRVNLPSEK